MTFSIVDLRCDDAPEPIAELTPMLDLHDLYFGSTPPRKLLPYDAQLAERLAVAGYRSGDVRRDLYDWMSRENFEERGTTTGSIPSSCGTCARRPRRPDGPLRPRPSGPADERGCR